MLEGKQVGAERLWDVLRCQPHLVVSLITELRQYWIVGDILTEGHLYLFDHEDEVRYVLNVDVVCDDLRCKAQITRSIVVVDGLVGCVSLDYFVHLGRDLVVVLEANHPLLLLRAPLAAALMDELLQVGE